MLDHGVLYSISRLISNSLYLRIHPIVRYLGSVNAFVRQIPGLVLCPKRANKVR